MTRDANPQEYRVQPNDQLAERIVLGSMLRSRAAVETALSMLVGRDFYVPNHGTIFETIAALFEDRQPTEIGAVNAQLLANGTLKRVGGAPYLVELLEAAQTPTQVAYYANIVAEYAHRRAVIDAGTEIVQRAWDANGMTSSELNDWALDRLRAAAAGTGETLTDDGMDTDALLAEPPGYDWLIPGLMERGDRLMLTGAEGHGKSTLTRQIAVQTAAGIHPFTLRPTEPKRVLVIDCENGQALSMRRYNPLLIAARDEGHPVVGTLRLHLEPGGLDLTQRGGSGWLLRRVERFKPDLLVIGPLYRLHFGDPNDERDARRVAAALDRAREAVGCALILEAHSPHLAGNSKTRTLRPVGSSLWLRWPEFGYGLAQVDGPEGHEWRVSDFKSWRGPRDERSWPKRVRTGKPWPWIDDNEEPRWTSWPV